MSTKTEELPEAWVTGKEGAIARPFAPGAGAEQAEDQYGDWVGGGKTGSTLRHGEWLFLGR